MPEVTLEELTEEASAQPEVLAAFARSELPKVPKGSIFVGAGDSYAAAVAASYASKGEHLALDPYSLVAFPEAASGRDAVFVSVSGRTSSNVAAARSVRKLARRTLVVTSDEQSQLARSADEIVKLPMKYIPRRPGILSFSLSLLAVLRISSGGGECDFRRAFLGARRDSGAVRFGTGTTYFLGNSAAYAVSLYSAAKAYEILGARSHPELLEEFSHQELFSLRKSDSVNIFGCFDPRNVGRKLCELLTERGHAARVFTGGRGTDFEELFRSVFAVQLATLREASARGLKGPRFLSSRSLGISDRMIY
jgi:hypothetical protein